jgi:hypothetical protein
VVPVVSAESLESLRSALGVVGSMDVSGYSVVSREVLAGAVERARGVVDGVGVSQGQVDEALAGLVGALAGLRGVDGVGSQVSGVGVVSRVGLSQRVVTVVKGRSWLVPVVVYLSDGSVGKRSLVGWKSSNPRVARVDGSGRVRGVRSGTVTVTAVGPVVEGGKSVTASIRVKVVVGKSGVKVRRVSAVVPRVMGVGDVAYTVGRYSPARAVSVKVRYRSSNPGVLVVDKAGRLTAKAPGKTIVTITAGTTTKKYPITIQ